MNIYPWITWFIGRLIETSAAGKITGSQDKNCMSYVVRIHGPCRIRPAMVVAIP